MKRNRPRVSPAMIVALLALFLAVGVPAVWSHGGNAQAVHACVTNSTGQVTVIADPTGYGNPNLRCQRPNEQHDLDWNQVGAQGPQGPQGPAGPAGPQGLPGPASADLKWYSRNFKATLRTSDGTSPTKVVGSLDVPGGQTYLVQANLSLSTSLSAPQVWCTLLGNSQPGYGGSPVVGQFYSRWKVPGIGRKTPFALLNLHWQTLSLQAVMTLPRGRSTSKVFVRCGFGASGATKGFPPPPPVAVVEPGQIHAIRLGGAER